MTSTILLALLLPACGSAGTVVLDDTGNLEEEVEEEEEEEEVGPIEYSVEIQGFNVNLGGEYCSGAFTLTLDEGVLTGEGLCVSEFDWVSDTQIQIQAEVTDEDPDGVGSISYDAGWGDPLEAEGDLVGEVGQEDLALDFTVEVDFGGWTDTYDYSISGS